jgi:hypothetical protein
MPVKPISVVLRPLTDTTLEPVHQLLSDWNVVQYMLLPHCKTKDESDKCLHGLIAENPDVAWSWNGRAVRGPASGKGIGRLAHHRRFTSLNKLAGLAAR